MGKEFKTFTDSEVELVKQNGFVDFGDVDTENVFNDTGQVTKEVSRKKHKDLLGGVKNGILFAVFTPLSLAFSVISFVTHIVGYITSLGVLATFYYAYLVYVDFTVNGAVTNFDNVKYGIEFLLFPIAVFCVSSMARAVSDKFADIAK